MAGLSYGTNYGSMGLYGTPALGFGSYGAAQPNPYYGMAIGAPVGTNFGPIPEVAAPGPSPYAGVANYGSPSVPATTPTTPTDPTDPATTAWDSRNALGKLFYNKDGGFNLGNIKDVASIVSSLGQLWGSFQQNKLAKDAFKFEKQAYQTNLANTISSYNLGLEDRITARYAQEGRTGEAQSFIDKHKL